MGLRDTLRNIGTIIGAQGDANTLLEPLLAAHGIEAALLDYDSTTRQVILAIRISGQNRLIPLPTGQRLSRAEIAALIASPPQVIDAAAQLDPGGHVRREHRKLPQPEPAGQIEVIEDDQAKPPPQSG